MKVLALGGSGGMGRFAVRALADSDIIDSIVVADLNRTAAEAFSFGLPDTVSSLGLDVTDGDGLRAAMREADVVANFVGPFFSFGPPVLKAAIESCCHYLDICDDWEPTLAMLEQDEAAQRAGITAILGLGASPGLTNLLALLAMRELDSVHTVITGWNMGGAIGRKSGEEASVGATLVDLANTGMGFVTGVPLACGVEMLARGQITTRGVLAPEAGAIPIKPFFELLDAKSSLPIRGPSNGIEISRSWDPEAGRRYAAAVERSRERIAR